MLVAQVLQPLLASRRPGRILVLEHKEARSVVVQPVSPAQIIRLGANGVATESGIRCRIDALPFDQAVFDLVVLVHLLRDGHEAVLAETLRVLTPGGDVLLSGLNSTGLRYRFGNRKSRFPGLRLNTVSHFLKTQSFDIKQCLLMGLAGSSRPAPKPIWHGIRIPFADHAVLHGCHWPVIKNANFSRKRSPQVQYAG